ncbi:MAG: hypothetical protein ACUZ8H_10600, partial [Candidatus Anammoxibacter sp.]
FEQMLHFKIVDVCCIERLKQKLVKLQFDFSVVSKFSVNYQVFLAWNCLFGKFEYILLLTVKESKVIIISG